MNSWQEVETKFGAIMHPERLLYDLRYVTAMKLCNIHIVNLNPLSQAKCSANYPIPMHSP